MSTTEQSAALTDDERRLAELGYKQELHRGWSGFTNFAISFTIISVLAGLLHDASARPGTTAARSRSRSAGR